MTLFLFLLLGFCGMDWSELELDDPDDEKIEIYIEEAEFHILVAGFYVIDDSLKLIDTSGLLSYSLNISGVSENMDTLSYIKSDTFSVKNINGAIVSTTIDKRDTLFVSLAVFKDSLLIESRKITWIRPMTKLELASQKATERVRKKFNSEIEIDGLIIDQSRTKSGRDFYELFYNEWRPPRDASGYTIHIIEEPARGRSTIIHVMVNEHTVYKRFLQTRYDVIEEMAESAIEATVQKLRLLENIKSEIQQGDLMGNGIY